MRRMAEQEAYEAFAHSAMEAWLRGLPAAEYAALLADATRELEREIGPVAPEQREDLARHVFARQYRERAGIPAFQDWRRAAESPPSG